MSFLQIRRYSDALEKRVSLQVILPDVGEPPFPVLVLLHGLSDDDTGWVRKSRLEHYLRDLPLIVVMPDGFRGWYTSNHRGPDYGHYIAVETVDYVDRFFATTGQASQRGIGGLSMGGYGAILACLSYPERFASCSSHSGALRPWAREPKIWTDMEIENVFGPEPEGSLHDLRSHDWSKLRARLWIDCGLEDAAWLRHNRELADFLVASGQPHVYRELEGGHDWDYWDARCPELLAFHFQELSAGLR